MGFLTRIRKQRTRVTNGMFSNLQRSWSAVSRNYNCGTFYIYLLAREDENKQLVKKARKKKNVEKYT